jgi:hypothetical protein
VSKASGWVSLDLPQVKSAATEPQRCMPESSGRASGAEVLRAFSIWLGARLRMIA